MNSDPDVSVAPAMGPWKVLVVDDEPSVHEMSRLILADLRFDDREVELVAAASAAHARDLLDRHADIALVLLDVVMETDQAGLALVQHVRDELRNHDVQIVLRTGQPGVAPEADLMRSYEINGYFLKTEITAQRLRSIVISALRGYRHARALRQQPQPGASADGMSTPPGGVDASQRRLAAELAGLEESQAVRMQVQPEVSLSSGLVAGAELVPLWITSMGPLPAQRIGSVMAADPATLTRTVRWLVAQALYWGRAWSAALGRPLSVSIPLVGDRLADVGGAACDAVLATLRAHAPAPRGALDLLVAEATLLRDGPPLKAALKTLRGAGVSVTMTDFGARTISLPLLKGVVPERLKLHRLFVRDVMRDPERQALARSLIALAQTMSITSIADGIASDGDAQFFRWEGCELGQGDALGPACTPENLTASAPPQSRLT